MDKKVQPHGTIAQVLIAEQLAGVPWTSARAKLHMVNEISLALHKVLIFNNNLSNPFQKWDQGRWFSSWSEDSGEHTCTIFVSIAVSKTKVKPRKGRNVKWQHVPAILRNHIASHTREESEDIAAIEEDELHWFRMAGVQPPTNHVITPNHTATSNTEEPSSSVANPVTPDER